MTAGHPTAQPYSRAGLLAKLTGAATLAAGALLYGNATSQLQTLALGTAGRVLVAGASAPAWSSKLAEGTITGLMTLGKAGSTARTMTFQDADTTVAGTNLAQTFTASQTLERSTTSGVAWATRVTADTVDRWRVRADGQMDWGAGSAFATDVTLYRTGVGVLGCTATLTAATSFIASPGSLPVTLAGNSVSFDRTASVSYINQLGIGGSIAIRTSAAVANDTTAITFFTAGITAGLPLTVPNGTAAAPGVRTSENHGLYRNGATALGFSVAGSGAAILATSAGATYRTGLFLVTADSVQPAWIAPGANSDAFYFGGSSAGGLGIGGQVRLYGSTHATKADRVEFTRGSTVSAYFDSSGNLICNGTLSATSLTASSLTATRVPFSTTGGLLTDSAEWTRPTAGGGSYISHLPTATGTGSAYSTYSILYSNPSGNNSGTLHGAYMEAQSTAANAFNYTSATWGITGFIGVAQHYGSGTAASVIGGGFGPVARPGCGVVAFMAGFKCLLQNLHTSQAVTLGVGAEISSPTNSGGNFGTYKGINIGATAVGTTNCIGLDIGAMTGTGPFAIRTAAGIVSFGDTTDASAVGTAAHVVAGGGGYAKSLWVGGTAGNYINIANATGELRVNNTKVVAARNTGWTAQTAGASKADLGASPTVGAIASFCRSLYDALAGHGLIGA